MTPRTGMNQATSRPRVLIILGVGSVFGQRIFRGISAFMRHQPVEPFDLDWLSATPGLELRGWNGQGIIIEATHRRYLDKAMSLQVPVVNISSFLYEHPVPSVLPDNRAIGCLAAQHLIDRGFRSLAFYGVRDWALSDLRLQGFVETAAAHGVPVERQLVTRPALRKNERTPVRPQLESWIDSLHKPMGIFACSDLMARPLLGACQNLGISVPEQVAVVGVDDDEVVCETARPSLSSVDTNAYRIGYEAAAMLTRLIDEDARRTSRRWHRTARSRAEVRLIAPPGVTIRQSSDTLAVPDSRVATALRYIRSQIDRPISVMDVVEHVGSKRRWLERRFQRVIGRSPHDEIRRVRIERAQRMLSTTNLSLEAIALRCGFAQSSRLTEAFRQQVGCTPSDYRRMHKSPLVP